MQLTADRLEVREGERLRALAIVHTPAPALAVVGGLPHLRHTLEDIGFRAVTLRMDAPAWFPDDARPALASLESLVWIDATPVRSMSLARDLTEDLTITQARAVKAAVATRPYGVVVGVPLLLAGRLWVFGVAYPLAALEEAS